MILVTAATKWEARPLAKAWGLVPDGPGLYRGLDGLLLAQTGIGPEPTLKALELLEAHGAPRLVISAGFAGALQPGIRSGDIVVDPHGAPFDYLEAARRAAATLGAPLQLGRMVSVSQALCEPEQKRAIGENRRAVAVDMESASIRQWALAQGADFMALRVVLDSLEQRLPQGLPKSERPADLAVYALERLPELPLMIKLAALQRRAMKNLCAFLSRFLSEVHERETADAVR